MKQKLIHIFQPILLWCLAYVLKQLRPLFQNEDFGLQQCLRNNNFHLALCNHPSILFGERCNSAPKHICFLNFKVWFLAKCVRIGLLKTEAGHRLLNRLGIPTYFGNGVEFWFEESHSPIIQYSIPNNVEAKGKIAVYTALTGDYDNVNEILYKEDGVDYILFTNNPSLKSKTWRIVLVDSDLDNLLLSREIKIFPHKYLDSTYDVSIYIDANAVIYGELTKMHAFLSDRYVLAITKHSIRTTLKEEFEACVLMIGIDQQLANSQYERYIQEGFVENIPLVECGLLVRKHKNVKLQYVMEEWYNNYRNGIKRDQLSLLPSISKLNFQDYVVMDGSVWHNQFLKLVSHKK